MSAMDKQPPPSRFSVLRLSDIGFSMVKDDPELGSGHIHPSKLNPFTMAFWNWLSLKVAAKLLVKFINPRTFAASLDEQLQEDARGTVRCLRDGRNQVRVNDQFLDFVDLRHGLTLRIAAPNEAQRSSGRESTEAAA